MENRLKYASGWKKKLKALVPRRLKYTLLADVIELLLRKTRLLDGEEEPPRFIEFGGGGFIPTGNALVALMAARTGLTDGASVVDIGSGIGRNAVALSKRFANLSYVGFDIVRYGTLWCRKRFSGSPGYQFIHADIFNSFYNPRGTESALGYRFPVVDGTTDLIFATSVFTHMPRAEVEHYLRESARCMKPGAAAYFTCFILDEEARRQIESGQTLFRFLHPRDGGHVESLSEPDLAVGFDGPVIEAMARDAGLEVEAFYPGNWRGLPYEDFQDAYVLRRDR